MYFVTIMIIIFHMRAFMHAQMEWWYSVEARTQYPCHTCVVGMAVPRQICSY